MKKFVALVMTVLAGMLILSGCVSTGASSSDSENTSLDTASAESSNISGEITVFAAASLTEALNEIHKAYNELYPDVTIVLNFDSSGTLKTQIEQGAEADIFISAAQKQMNGLEESGYIKADTRKNILINKVVLIAPENKDVLFDRFEDCATDKVSLIAIGNQDVPVGQYAEEIFTNLNIWENIQSKASLGSNVKEVLSQVENESVDCGVVYSTDAKTANGIKVICEAPEGSHSPVVYPAAILETSENTEAAQNFIEFLTKETAKEKFEAVGFTMAE